MLSKTCSYCEKTFYAINQEDFSKNFNKAKLGLYGFTARCKACRKKLETEKYKKEKSIKDKLNKPSKIKNVKKFCQVCSKEFYTTEGRDDISTCSKECSVFRRKIYNKVYHKKHYNEIAKNKRDKEAKRRNHKKIYTEKEIRYILNNIDTHPSIIAQMLGRTTLSIRKKIANLKKETK